MRRSDRSLKLSFTASKCRGKKKADVEVSADEIIAAYRKLAAAEGVFAEPASCASIAGVYKDIQNGKIAKGSTVVAVLTGNGLKDPNTAIDFSPIKPVVLPNEEKAVAEYIKGVVHS